MGLPNYVCSVTRPVGCKPHPTSVIFATPPDRAMLPDMAHFPHPHTRLRAPRVCLAAGESISFFLGRKQIGGVLQVASTTGGLVRLLQPLNPGTLADVSLHMTAGTVNALVEFLQPRRQGPFFAQAFRFLAFGDDDYDRFDLALQILRNRGW